MSSSIEIAIVDYQMGNLRSVQKAFERVGASAVVTSDADQIARARRVVLPGVGAFPDAMRELQSRSLVQPILDSIQSGKPFLGICLGLQLLFETGTEGGEHPGLALFPGRVVRFELPSEYKIPHMGWNRIRVAKQDCPLMTEIPDNTYFYFVHSYFVLPTDPQLCWLECDYGQPFCAAIWRDNVFATQFHPEKSQQFGLRLLENFSRI